MEKMKLQSNRFSATDCIGIDRRELLRWLYEFKSKK
jgi:hypothetical protein